MKFQTAMMAAALAAAAMPSAWAADGLATGDTAGKKIALSNNYAGNSWRQAMLKSWDEVATTAKGKKLVADAPAFTTSTNSATEQAQQVQNMILQGFDAIVIDAASPTAINGAIKAACDAGIIVVSFDGISTEPCAYRIAVDFAAMGALEVDYLAKRLNGTGTLLEIRGLAGVSVDDEIHGGMVKELTKYPGLKVAASVHGDWTQTVAQKEVAGVLPTLPKIDGVLTQGGDGYGTAQAFKAAGRPEPIIVMGNRQDELTWWQQQKDANGYETMSVSIAPAASQVGFWVAQQLLAGKTVPKQMTLPLVVVEQGTLAEWLKRTPEGGVTNATYTPDWTAKAIDATAAGQPVPLTPTN